MSNIQKTYKETIPDGYIMTKVGVIPEDWKCQKLSMIIEKSVGGGTPSTKHKNYWQGELPWISSSDLSEEGISKISPIKMITKNAVANSATKKVEKGSIIVVTRVGLGKIGISEFNELYTSQDFNNILRLLA